MTNAAPETTARLIFAGEHLLSLKHIGELARAALDQRGLATLEIVEPELLTLELLTAETVLRFDIAFEDDETHLWIQADTCPGGAAAARRQTRLVQVAYELLRHLSAAQEIIWRPRDHRISREAFLEMMTPVLGTLPAPRARPQPRAAAPRSGGKPPRHVPHRPHRFDAHVESYETHMRDQLRHMAEAPEPLPAPVQPSLLRRVSSWALHRHHA